MTDFPDFLSDGEMLELSLRRDEISKADLARSLKTTPNRITQVCQDRKPLLWAGVVRDKVYRALMDGGTLKDWEWLWLLRRRRGMTVREMARGYGVSHVTVLAWERGRGEWWRGVRWWDGVGP